MSANAGTRKERRQARRRQALQRWVLPVVSRPMRLGAEPILVFAPHADDETLGCGGLIALKRRAGCAVTVVFLTDGSRSHEGRAEAPSPEALAALRREEARTALGTLSVPPESIHFLDFPDGALGNLPQDGRAALQAALADLLQRYRPALVFVPHRLDGHADHTAAYEAVTAAIALDAATSTAVYAYPVWLFWTRNRLFGNLPGSALAGAYRLPIGSALEQKRQAMAAYRSQLEVLPPGFVEPQMAPDEYFFRVR